MSDTQIIDSLIQSVTDLTRHLEAENSILGKHDPVALVPLVEEKERLTTEYLDAMNVIRRNPALVQALPGEKKERLRRAGDIFNIVMEEHYRRVTALKTVNEGVIRAISDHVAAKNRPVSYGQEHAAMRRQNTAPTSIVVDRNI